MSTYYEITLTQEQLLAANLHLGSTPHVWNPYSAKFLAGRRDYNYIIDLTYTTLLLQRAFFFLSRIYELYGFTAFINQNAFIRTPIHRALTSSMKHFYFPARWQPGLLTNFKELIRNYQDDEIPSYHFACIKQLPKALFLAQTAPNYWIINEARRVNIPLIILVETEFSPNLATFPIPCNNNSPELTKLFANLYGAAVANGICSRRDELDVIEIIAKASRGLTINPV